MPTQRLPLTTHVNLPTLFLYIIRMPSFYPPTLLSAHLNCSLICCVSPRLVYFSPLSSTFPALYDLSPGYINNPLEHSAYTHFPSLPFPFHVTLPYTLVTWIQPAFLIHPHSLPPSLSSHSLPPSLPTYLPRD